MCIVSVRMLLLCDVLLCYVLLWCVVVCVLACCGVARRVEFVLWSFSCCKLVFVVCGLCCVSLCVCFGLVWFGFSLVRMV